MLEFRYTAGYPPGVGRVCKSVTCDTRATAIRRGGVGPENYCFLLVQKEYFFLSPLYTLSKKREEHVTCHNYPPVTVGKVGCSDCVMWHVRGRDPQGGMGLENYFSYCSKRMIFFSPLPSLSKERERHNTSHNYLPVAVGKK